jgi:hypothetical protein
LYPQKPPGLSMRVFTSHNFSESNADVILLATAEDGFVSNFHVHKEILSEASPFFETLFSLQQPSQPDQPGTLTRSLSGLPTVRLPDPAQIHIGIRLLSTSSPPPFPTPIPTIFLACIHLIYAVRNPTNLFC